jgi:(1->4)-alpha-D-glucan 1-alpha-D-glucosylmutase
MGLPTSTYRLQIDETFDLFAAARRLPYLRELGVDWVYLSPLLAAEPGSKHGYDVVAHDHVDPARGGADGLAELSAEARRMGMGVLVDIVPNHVGVATPEENAWWWDLLARGRGSGHADAFDVDWDAAAGRIRIPVLGDDGPDAVEIDTSARVARYHEHTFPLAPGTSSLDEQHYELVHWTVADHGLNYRRFFAVNTLAGVRVEDPQVLRDTHVEIRRWIDEGLVDGLRVDHPDGLRDPVGYLESLSKMTGGSYVLVEKILEAGERLPEEWATHGTTGYDALAMVERVLVDPAGREPLEDLENRLRGGIVEWHQLCRDTKRAVADGILGSEVRRLTRELAPYLPDLSSDVTADAVAELLACFPVYRSYLPDGRAHLDEALALARERRPDLTSAFDAVGPVLADPSAPPALRFQQTSGAVMAKGVEDCAFYRWSRLTSLNEVGGDPSVFVVPPSEFHAWAAERQRDWPAAMTALSTHDTKRGEDVRARITALAEVPGLWERTLDRLLELAPLPDPAFGNLLWQAVVGAWPADPSGDLRARLHGYAEKAMREAGDRTTWTRPDPDYERAVHAAVDAAFDRSEVGKLVADLAREVAAAGWSNALGAKLVALTIPGVPDVYQGSELWEQSLVDPDNRRPVDFDLRQRMLAALTDTDPRAPDAVDDPGLAKLAVTRAALTLRRERPELFDDYRPLTPEGPAADHCLAFDRGGAVTVVTRLPRQLADRQGWGETELELPEGAWQDVITGSRWTGRVPLGAVLADLPVALLSREEER